MTTLTPHLKELITRSQKIVQKYKHEHPELWNDVEKQINLISSTDTSDSNQNIDALNFGPRIALMYDSTANKDEMQVLYSLYFMAKML